MGAAVGAAVGASAGAIYAAAGIELAVAGFATSLAASRSYLLRMLGASIFAGANAVKSCGSDGLIRPSGPVVGAGAVITKGEQVTEQVIREAMKNAPLKSQQAGGVSLPLVQRYVDRLVAGEAAPAIKVDGHMIVDGNHRYIAARILGKEPPIQPWAGGRPDNAVSWENLPIDPAAW